MSIYRDTNGLYTVGGREMVEFCVNPHSPEHSDSGLYGNNNRRWTEALKALGLIIPTKRNAIDNFGRTLPGIKAQLHHNDLYANHGNQYALLSMVSKEDISGLGIHMVDGFKGLADRDNPELVAGKEPRVLTLEEVLADIAQVTVGGVRRHQDIDPANFQPMIDVCKALGTIDLLTQQAA